MRNDIVAYWVQLVIKFEYLYDQQKTMKNELNFAFTIILSGLFFCLYSCDFASSTSYGDYGNDQSYEETKWTLEEKEQENPLSFLSTDGQYWQKRFGKKWIIEGTISNSASIATYKDVVLEIQFYSGTNTFISSTEHIFYEYFPAGTTEDFKIVDFAPEGTESINWKVKRASAVY